MINQNKRPVIPAKLETGLADVNCSIDIILTSPYKPCSLQLLLQHLQLTVFSNAKDMIRIEAMFIGEPREISDDKETWLSGIYRSRVEGQIELRENRLVGDRVVDNKNHGRPGQAVCVHPITHYDFWNDVWAVYPRRNFPHLHLFGGIGDQQLF
jgi:hypothetical protein